jgi:hypothetical protein
MSPPEDIELFKEWKALQARLATIRDRMELVAGELEAVAQDVKAVWEEVDLHFARLTQKP